MFSAKRRTVIPTIFIASAAVFLSGCGKHQAVGKWGEPFGDGYISIYSEGEAKFHNHACGWRAIDSRSVYLTCGSSRYELRLSERNLAIFDSGFGQDKVVRCDGKSGGCLPAISPDR
ncbi:hypothetical protein [Thiohalomonas denitrificans]|uniref:hypothetical protein n=1 Tax=Thiohalomonas denitrificans TaxID=415747 RepID=UPI0011144EC9|nr:hypothetical protein [Thiohalomonas denitrificans]